MCAIVGALQSDAISCLDLTHKAMLHKDQRQYHKLTTLIKQESNYSAYKAAVWRDDKRGCIPWHGTHFKSFTLRWADCFGLIAVHLHDINVVLQKEADVKEHREAPLINFEKWTHLKEKALAALHHRDIPLEYNEDGLETAMAYLRQQLQPIIISDDFSRRLQIQTVRLELEEETMRRGRAIRLVNLDWRDML